MSGDSAQGLSLCLGTLDFLSLRPLLTGHYLEDYFVALVQRLEAFAEYCRVMDKYILANFLSNETQALFVVPPFDFAFSHNYLLNALRARNQKNNGHTPDRVRARD
jgi:hypothetical protein